jgi:threonine dehydrogenase-like Zn-dependent dehydrogenase
VRHGRAHPARRDVQRVDRDKVLGYEPAGRVAEVGRNVRGYLVGQPGALYQEIVCRRCYFHQRGRLRRADVQERCSLRELRRPELVDEYLLLPGSGDPPQAVRATPMSPGSG